MSNLLDWFMQAIRGVYTPSIGMYDTSIGLNVGTPITSPVNGVVIGGNYLPSGMYGVYGRQAWGGEVDILTNLVGYGQKVVVDVIHFDTIAPNIVPGAIVTQGELLGTSGGQLSGGNWPVQNVPGKLPFSTGPHIGVGVRSSTGFTPAWDAAPLIYELRNGTVQSSVPQGYGSSDAASSQGTPAGNPLGGGLIGGLLPWLSQQATGSQGWWAQLIAGVEQDVTGFAVRAGLVTMGLLLVLVGIVIFFFTHPQEPEQQNTMPLPAIEGEAAEAPEAAAVAA